MIASRKRKGSRRTFALGCEGSNRQARSPLEIVPGFGRTLRVVAPPLPLGDELVSLSSVPLVSDNELVSYRRACDPLMKLRRRASRCARCRGCTCGQRDDSTQHHKALRSDWHRRRRTDIPRTWRQQPASGMSSRCGIFPGVRGRQEPASASPQSAA